MTDPLRSTPDDSVTPAQLERVGELRLLDNITLAVRLMKAEEQLRTASEKLEPEIERAMIAAYRAGMKDGITDYAIWKDGGQYVGALQRPLRDVLKKVDEIDDRIALQSALRNING